MIVHLFYEIRKPELDIGQCPVFPEVDLFCFQSFHEALGRSIVVRIPLPGHADLESILQQDIHIVMGGILHSLVGMVDDSFLRLPVYYGHHQCFQR